MALRPAGRTISSVFFLDVVAFRALCVVVIDLAIRLFL